MIEEIESPTFKEEFWAWFDTLPVLEKQKFWYYGSDMAELFYYNKIYSRTKIDVDKQNFS
jgi:hypothetical protein